VETNSDGFRTHEFYPKPDGTYRILLLGDSFVYGANADQDETLGVKLEQGLKKILNEDIEVLSLGVSSYSGLRYAVLMRLYLDKLDPDMVIVAVDQSDLQEDVDRLDHYRLDQDGYPVILKSAEELMRTQGHNRIVIDSEGKLKVEERGRNWLLDMRITSRLFDRTYRLAASIRHRILNSKAASIYAEDHGGDIIRYETLVSEHGTDLSAVLPKRMQVDTIPFDLETAVKRYEPTLRSLRYIKRETASRGMELILTSYPYPWMVSIREALPYQLLGFNAIYDFRSNRVHPNLMDRYAEELDITHLNAYPVFENQTRRLYGNYDPHFNADGYARYAEFLTSSIRDLLNKDTAGASSLLP
jgi:lysophospholipase L1-like esterase